MLMGDAWFRQCLETATAFTFSEEIRGRMHPREQQSRRERQGRSSLRSSAKWNKDAPSDVFLRTPLHSETPVNLERYRWPALACLMCSTVHADDTNRHSATVSVHGDENDNRQWLGKLALSVGDYSWVQGIVGRTELATARANDTSTVGVGFGMGGRTVSASVEFVQRSGDGQLEQQDWSAALNWRGARGGLGADLFVRSASSESNMTQSGGVLASAVNTTVRESVDARGFGLHGDFSLTPRARVFAGAMRYQYDFTADPAATAGNTPLSFLLGSDAVVSGVWREQAFIGRSYRVGGSYRFQNAAVSAQYLRDRTTRTDQTLDTMQLQAEFPIAGHWLVSPTVGYSSGGSLGHAGFAGLSLSFNW